MIDDKALMELIQIVKDGMANRITKDNITVYRVGDMIRIDIKEEK